MYLIDNQSRRAVYEQIVEQTERFVLADVLRGEEPMPSVRSLSIELSVNPNTIQKAYSELDRRGIIYSVAGRGSFVAPDAREKLRRSRLSLLDEIENHAAECAVAGIAKEAIYAAVDKGYGRNGGEEQ